MRRATGRLAVGVLAVVCAAALLTGCQAHSAASQPVNGVVTPASGSTAGTPAAGTATGAATANSTSGANGPAGAGADSELNTVDGQLSGLDSAMAHATQSPSDGG